MLSRPALLGPVLLLLLCGEAAADLLAREAFFSHPDRVSPTLSPDGRHIAYLAPDGGRVSIWLAPADAPGMAWPLIEEAGRGVFSYQWAEDGRHIIYRTGRNFTYWLPNRDGDDFVVYALDTETGESRPLTKKLDRRVRIQTSPAHPDAIFLSPSPRLPGPRLARLIDIRTGEARMPKSSAELAPVYADTNLEPRLATGWAEVAGIRLMARPPGQDWRLLRTFSFAERLTFDFHGFDTTGAHAYITHAAVRDTGALVKVVLADGTEQEIAHAPDAEITAVLTHPESGAPVAYRSGRQKESWTVLDGDYATDFERLKGKGTLSIVSQTQDGQTWLVAFETDRSPEHYHLYRRRDGSLVPLFSKSERRSGLEIAAMHPVEITARDGLGLVGYLTLPDSSRRARPLPMVLWVHGGPHSRERWRYDRQAQWLASRGYAVLSVNFRGSTGFGKAFIEASYGEWGGTMQNDLMDAAAWAIAENIADPDRIGLMGLSHGGYAVLSLLATEPDRFACGVAMSGLSDLNLFLDTLAAYQEQIDDREILAEFQARLMRDRMQLGGDERTPEGRAALAARSPLTYAGNIRAPLLAVHGLRDRGVVPEHSGRIVDALASRGAPVTYLTYADAGHGLFRPGNWISYAATVEHFLEGCLGGAAAPLTESDFAETTVAVPVGAEHISGLAEMLKKIEGTSSDP